MSIKLKEMLSDPASRPSEGRYVCPVCNGGQSGESSLQVFHNGDGVGAVCYRASCHAKAYVPLTYGDKVAGAGAPSARRSPPYTEPATYNISDGMEKTLAERWRLYSCEEHGWRQVSRNKLYIPIRELGNIRRAGHVIRNTSRFPDGPKSMTFFRQDFSQSVFLPTVKTEEVSPTNSGIVVLVEDPLSALRLTRPTGLGHPPLAVYGGCLLGTSLSRRGVDCLSSFGRPVVVALDADATAQAARVAQKLMTVTSVRMVRLEKDVKDMGPDELDEFLRRLLE